MQSDLFTDEAYGGPPGLHFLPDFLSAAEAAQWLARIGELTLVEATYKDYAARRRVASFGGTFNDHALELRAGPDIPSAFGPLLARVAAHLGAPPDAFAHLLVAEYRPGTPLGWHRDVPDFESIVGLSLAGTATMRFRPYPHPAHERRPVLQLQLPPRSLYVIEGPARWHWQHSVAPTPEQRFSITLRTRRGAAPLRNESGADRH